MHCVGRGSSRREPGSRSCTPSFGPQSKPISRPGRRQEAHARAARLLAAEDAAPERVAAQLAGVEPAADPWACARLMEASGEALGRGDPEAAARHLSRALEEPPSPEDRAGLLLELATAEALVFSERASEHLRAAFRVGDRDQRLEAALTLTAVDSQNARAGEAFVLLNELREEFAGQPAAVAEIEAHMVCQTVRGCLAYGSLSPSRHHVKSGSNRRARARDRLARNVDPSLPSPADRPARPGYPIARAPPARAHAGTQIHNDKDTGLRNLLFRDFEHDRVWLAVTRIAHDRLVWTQPLLLSGELARAEPKRLRYRVLHVAARLAFHARDATPRIHAAWPWAHETPKMGSTRARRPKSEAL